MNYQEALNVVTRDREQALVRLGYLEGQAELLRVLIQEEQEKANRPDPPNSEIKNDRSSS